MIAKGAAAATLYLHIGTHKTGTTAIQNFCYGNRRELKRRGYYFPTFARHSRKLSPLKNAAFMLTVKHGPDGGFASGRDEAIWRAYMDDIIRHLARYPSAILTSEQIWNCPDFADRGMWMNLRAEAEAHGFEVKIVVYLRRQDQMLISYWSQKVKRASGKCDKQRFEEVLARAEDWYVLDYYKRLEEIASIFGRERILVRIYEREKFRDGDVLPDFLELVGLDASLAALASAKDANPSIHGNALEIKRIINAMPNIDAKALALAERIAVICSGMEKGSAEYAPLSAEEQSALLEKYAESNRLIARDYLGDANVPLFHPPEKLPPKWEANNAQMYESIVRFFTLALQMMRGGALHRSLPQRVLRRLRCVWRRIWRRILPSN